MPHPGRQRYVSKQERKEARKQGSKQASNLCTDRSIVRSFRFVPGPRGASGEGEGCGAALLSFFLRIGCLSYRWGGEGVAGGGVWGGFGGGFGMVVSSEGRPGFGGGDLFDGRG